MAALREVKPLEDVAGPQDEEDNNDVDSDECSWEEEEEEEEGELDCDSCGTDDSEEDPTFDVVEETRLALSSIALEKSKSRKTRKGDGENGSDRPLVEIPELDAKDRKCFEVVEKLIKDGQMEKLKVDQCKVYLRKYGLRLTGKKDTLIGRIREHLEIRDGGGERKYPISSFVVNCKGDACTGDVVMFEQNVYEMFSIASRSATGPPCGTRLVAGRIVKESYGAAKQQHTFTRWDDEENRRKVLQEKHARGSSARFSRDNRIQEKMLKKDRLDRIQKKSSETGGNKGILSQVDPFRAAVVLQQKIQHGQPPLQSLNSADLNFMQETIPKEMPASGPGPHPWMKLDKPTTSKHQSFVVQQHKIQHRQSLQHSLDSVESNDPKQATSFNENLRCDDKTIIIPENHNSFQQGSKQTSGYFPHHEITRRTLQKQNYLPDADQLHLHAECHRQYQPPQQRSHRMQPLVSVNSFHQIPPKRHHPVRNRESCRFYRQGRCYFGEECKYVHDN
ncbi:zinc finger CCCH domain-containing protein [Musa troglodytarum]|uniref:Zinc finger CCCH domain-containing protein n=1 Tax=Musa troglodytarum TaxID=320322 RepID=A0A9E7HU93_9LILI|nr:zinc finger CCCH domain-containing protein [Musa troglodytarum]